MQRRQRRAIHSPPSDLEDASQRGGPSHTSRRTPAGGEDDDGGHEGDGIGGSSGAGTVGQLPRLPGDESSDSESDSSSEKSDNA